MTCLRSIHRQSACKDIHITHCVCIAGNGHAEEHTSKPAVAASDAAADQQLLGPEDDISQQHVRNESEQKQAEASAAAAHAEEAVAEKKIEALPEKRQKTGTELPRIVALLQMQAPPICLFETFRAPVCCFDGQSRYSISQSCCECCQGPQERWQHHRRPQTCVQQSQ